MVQIALRASFSPASSISVSASADLVFEPLEQLAQFIQRAFVFFRKFKEHFGV